jgi:hypothetical protein
MNDSNLDLIEVASRERDLRETFAQWEPIYAEYRKTIHQSAAIGARSKYT